MWQCDAVASRRRKNAEPLRCRPSGRKQRTEEVVILRILDAIAIQILPPTAPQISGLAGTELSLAVREELEFAFHRQWILDHKRIVVECLAGHEDHPGRALPETRG